MSDGLRISSLKLQQLLSRNYEYQPLIRRHRLIFALPLGLLDFFPWIQYLFRFSLGLRVDFFLLFLHESLS